MNRWGTRFQRRGVLRLNWSVEILLTVALGIAVLVAAYLWMHSAKPAAEPAVEVPEYSPYESAFARDMGLGEIAYIKGEHDEAIEHFTRAIEKNPQSLKAYNSRGAAYLLSGKTEEAARDFDDAVRLDPKSALSYSQRALISLQLGKLDDARRDFDEALQIEPNSPLFLCGRSTVFAHLGKADFALTDASTALQLDPNCLEAYLAHGEACFMQGNFQQARDDAMEAIRRGHAGHRAATLAARACMRLDDYAAAIELIDPLIAEKPTRDELQLRGQAYMALTKWGLAIADFDAAIELGGESHPMRAWLTENRATCQRELARDEESRRSAPSTK